MHKRFFPRVNAFTYGVYYLALPLTKLQEMRQGAVFAIDRPALFSFYRKDHGDRDGGDLMTWARRLFREHAIETREMEIVLISMPRILGFVFNPVSFWMACDTKGRIGAVIAEVNNTYGETHSYICARDDGMPLSDNDWMKAKKLFHVSPFLERNGEYAFRFKDSQQALGIWIDYFHDTGAKQLATALTGVMLPLSEKSLIGAFLAIPFVTLKTILLIHWQALRLALKNIHYLNKPPQFDSRSSRAKSKLTNL